LHGKRTFLLPPILEADNIRIEICEGFFQGGSSQVKRANILAALLIALSLISTGCGSSDYVQSIQLTATGANSGGFFNLAGADGTLQLQVNTVYHSGKTVPVTNYNITYQVTTVGCTVGDSATSCGAALPAYDSNPAPVPIDPTGLMTAVAPLCTWFNAAPPPGTGTPIWEYTGYYQVTATYNGMVSQPVAIGVGSAVDPTSAVGGCGPT
jgi:hypothetical protein